MKTTSYEISKKLKEIGFKVESDYLWFEEGQAIRVGDWINPINKIERHNKEKITYLSNNHRSCFAYDLETILEALPSIIQDIARPVYCLEMDNNMSFGYVYRPIDDDINFKYKIDVRRDDKSLADTAARLLILLHEKGLVKFNKE